MKALLWLLLAVPAFALAHEDTPFGRAGDPNAVSRAIEVDMSDRMRFAPSEIRVKRGQTVRFNVKNSGKVQHEFVLGTMASLKEHAEMMRRHPGMEHDDPHSAHAAPGKRGTVVWQFTRPGEFYFACLVPGHFEAGMIGKVKVADATSSYSGEEARAVKAPSPLEDADRTTAVLQNEYRLSHLETHRRMRALLSDEQVRKYDALRGYAKGADDHHHRRHGN